MVLITIRIVGHRSIEIRFGVAAGRSIRKEGNFCNPHFFQTLPNPNHSVDLNNCCTKGCRLVSVVQLNQKLNMLPQKGPVLKICINCNLSSVKFLKTGFRGRHGSQTSESGYKTPMNI